MVLKRFVPREGAQTYHRWDTASTSFSPNKRHKEIEQKKETFNFDSPRQLPVAVARMDAAIFHRSHSRIRIPSLRTQNDERCWGSRSILLFHVLLVHSLYGGCVFFCIQRSIRHWYCVTQEEKESKWSDAHSANNLTIFSISLCAVCCVVYISGNAWSGSSGRDDLILNHLT